MTPGFFGADYAAAVELSGLHLEGGGVRVHTAGSEVEQGGVVRRLDRGRVRHAGLASAEIEYPNIIEEYRFENRRVEQLFRIARPIGDGALKIRVGFTTDVKGDLLPTTDGLRWKESGGERTVSYYGAVAIDAAGRRIELHPRSEAEGIILEVPAQFMASAKFPVIVDPWIQLGGSASGYGVSQSKDREAFNPSVAVDSKAGRWLLGRNPIRLPLRPASFPAKVTSI